MTSSRYLVGLFVGIVLVLHADFGLADEGPRKCKVTGSTGICHVKVHEDTPLIMHFDSPILGTDEPAKWKVKPDVQRGSDTIVLQVLPDAKEGELKGRMIVANRGYTLHVVTSPAASADDADDVIEVESKGTLSVFNTAVKAKAKATTRKRVTWAHKQCTAKLTAKDKKHAEANAIKDEKHAEEMAAKDEKHAEAMKEQERQKAQAKKESEERLQRSLLLAVHKGEHRSEPIISYEPELIDGILISDPEWTEIGGRYFFQYMAENRNADDFPVEQLEVFDQHNARNHVIGVQIGDADAQPGDNLLGTIPAGSKVPMTVELDDFESLGDYATHMMSTPKGPPQLREFKRVRPSRWDLHREARRVVIGARLLGGACWVADGLPNDTEGEGLDAAMCGGLSVRAAKGISELLALETEIIGARIGEVRFDDVTFNGMQGDLIRTANLVRVQFNGAVRLGRKKIPTLRLGIGAQGTDYNSEFITGNTTMDGPDTSFEFVTFLTFGAGFDYRFGEHGLAGFAISVTESRGDELFRRSLDAGIHISYALAP